MNSTKKCRIGWWLFSLAFWWTWIDSGQFNWDFAILAMLCLVLGELAEMKAKVNNINIDEEEHSKKGESHAE